MSPRDQSLFVMTHSLWIYNDDDNDDDDDDDEKWSVKRNSNRRLVTS